jgi:hypothetical protein
MQKTKGVFLALIFLMFVNFVFVFAQGKDTITLPPIQYDKCSNYYKFGSIEMSLNLDKADSKYSPNQTIELRGQMKNNNGYPITAGNVMIQIFLKGTKSDYLMDEFLVSDGKNKPINFSISQNGSRDFVLKYPAPLWGTGKYYIKASFVWNNKRIISQSSSLDFDFFANDTEAKYLIEGFKIKLNGEDTYNDSYIEYNPIDKIGKFGIEYNLVNPLKSSADIKVAYKIYKLNYFDSKNIIASNEETIKMNSNESKKISKSFSPLDPGLYVLEIMAGGQGIKTISRYNILVNGLGMGARINFAAINDFPITPKSPTFGFVCYNSFSDKYSFDGKLSLKLRDSSNNIVFATSTTQFSASQNLALKNDFILDKKYSKLWLDISLITKDGYTVDQMTLEYNCSGLKNVGQFETSISGSILNVVAQNKCGEKVEADILVEVKEKGGQVIASESSYGKEFKKKIKFVPGKEYEVKITSQGVEDIVIYKHGESNKLLYFVIGIVLIAGLVYASIYFNKKNNPVA